ncbi:hypothetical protein [Bacillus sp. mrc49]|uniref:hypothetical protein n=1 Tax=Bacillus sp. mrc49 TaxID=2054913 RepID=UPI0012FD5D43|nr:hypothetical protein [Bacillus sp. mrc49]
MDRSIALQVIPYPEAVLESPRLSACGVLRRRAIPAGVSRLPFHTLILKTNVES